MAQSMDNNLGQLREATFNFPAGGQWRERGCSRRPKRSAGAQAENRLRLARWPFTSQQKAGKNVRSLCLI